MRGTLSIDDAITDALAVPLCVGAELAPAFAHLAARGVAVPAPDAAYVHAGMWEAAKGIRASLLKYGLLEVAAARGDGAEAVVAAAAAPSPVWLQQPGDRSAAAADAEVGRPKDGRATYGTAASPGGAARTPGRSCGDQLEEGGNALRALQLVVVGHSLGAGVASLLALQVR